MSAYKVVNANALVDSATGVLIGFLGADGKEYFLPANAIDNDSAYLYTAPLTGFNQKIPGHINRAIIDPAGTLATGTITLSKGVADGQVLTIASNQAITALTIAASGCSLGNGMPTTIAAATGSIAFLWRAANNKWYRTR